MSTNPMISPLEAIEIIKKNTFSGKISSQVLENCFGQVLAEDLFADRDFPPFNRAMMDGLAIQDLESEQWEIEQTVYAGQAQVTLKNPSSGIEIMTGAPAPVNCSAIIPIEELQIETNENDSS